MKADGHITTAAWLRVRCVPDRPSPIPRSSAGWSAAVFTVGPSGTSSYDLVRSFESLPTAWLFDDLGLPDLHGLLSIPWPRSITAPISCI